MIGPGRFACRLCCQTEAVRTTYTIAAKGAQTERGEVLISNHALPG